ncbi:MAG: hypothetical protein AAF916_03420, partial [Planctomycetota bacterium]
MRYEAEGVATEPEALGEGLGRSNRRRLRRRAIWRGERRSLATAAAVEPGNAIRQTAAGTPMKYPDAADAGLFDLIAQDAGGLRSLAADWIRGQGAPPTRDGAPHRWIGRDAEPVREALA